MSKEKESQKVSPFSMRHAALLSLSVLSIILGAVSIFWAEGMEPFAPVFFLLALVFTITLGMIPSQRYFAFVWPLLFLLIGLLRHNDILLPTYLLFGFAFSVLFLSVRAKADNQVRTSFFPATIPGIKLFYLFMILGLAFGIYMGLPTEKVQEKITEQLNALEDASLPGIDTVASFANSAIKISLDDTQIEFSEEQIQDKVADICGESTECIQETTQRIQEELNLQTDQSSNTPIPKLTSEQVEKQVKGVLQNVASTLYEKVDLNTVLAVIFLLALLPFIGLFALLIGLLVSLFFWGLRHTGLVEIHEQEVKQKRYV